MLKIVVSWVPSGLDWVRLTFRKVREENAVLFTQTEGQKSDLTKSIVSSDSFRSLK